MKNDAYLGDFPRPYILEALCGQTIKCIGIHTIGLNWFSSLVTYLRLNVGYLYEVSKMIVID